MGLGAAHFSSIEDEEGMGGDEVDEVSSTYSTEGVRDGMVTRGGRLSCILNDQRCEITSRRETRTKIRPLQPPGETEDRQSRRRGE